jgi:hypothetical protein
MIKTNFTVSPTSGDVFATDFTFTDTTSGGSVLHQIWDLGTRELIYDKSNFTYNFKYPGTYNVSLSCVDFDGNYDSATKQIFVDIPYRDYLKFTQIPESYANPGKKTDIPFKFEVLSSNPNNPLLVDLFVDNSRSTPYNFIPSKWNFLTPTWKFLDKNLNIVSTLSVEPVKIYKNNKVVAVSGTGEFYYVDSMSTGNPSTNPPLIITATLQTSAFVNPQDSNVYSYPSYANNESVRSAVLWQVNDIFPTRIQLSENYLNKLNSRYWKGIKIPLLITVHSNRSDLIPGSKDETSEIIFSYPEVDRENALFKLLADQNIFSDTTYNYLGTEFAGAVLQESNFKILIEDSNITTTTTITENLCEDTQYIFG